MTGVGHIAFMLRAMLVLGALLPIGGCTLHGDRDVAVSAPEVPPPAGQRLDPAGVKTIRRTPVADEAGEPPVSDAAVPTPRQIFDFHPTGAAWRQPFVIDPNDGPLAGEVRRTAAELRSSLAAPKVASGAGTTAPTPHRCSETDVAMAKPGCGTARSAAPTGAAR